MLFDQGLFQVVELVSRVMQRGDFLKKLTICNCIKNGKKSSYCTSLEGNSCSVWLLLGVLSKPFWMLTRWLFMAIIMYGIS